MGDLPLEKLGNKTPLEAANKPAMDELFKKSTAGMVSPLSKGFPLGSDVGNMAILGNNPHEYYTGRAAMEAANLGIKLGPGEVAFRCNLVTIKDNKMEDYSAGHITTEEGKQLVKLLNKMLGTKNIKFYAGKGYRHIMVMKGGDKVKATPPHDITGQDIEKYLPKGPKGSEIKQMMKDSPFILDGHEVNINRRADGKNPANMIWLWGQGRELKLPSIKEKYGLDGAVISAVDLVNGIGISMGLDSVKVPGVTGYIDTNYKGKAEYALKALKKKDFIYLHVEATDEMGHNMDIEGKVKAVEKFDSEIVGPVFNGLKERGDDFKIMITSDHATPIQKGTHTMDPVPFVIYNSAEEKDNPVPEYSERSISENSDIKIENGWEILPYFIKEK